MVVCKYGPFVDNDKISLLKVKTSPRMRHISTFFNSCGKDALATPGRIGDGFGDIHPFNLGFNL